MAWKSSGAAPDANTNKKFDNLIKHGSLVELVDTLVLGTSA